jgi:hypothetical protein
VSQPLIAYQDWLRQLRDRTYVENRLEKEL